LTAVVVAWVLVLPALPDEDAQLSGGLMALAVAIVAQWTVLSGLVTVRLWAAGRGQPNAVKYRVRGLSLASAGLNIVIVVAVSASAGQSEAFHLVTQLLTLASIGLFYVAISPPLSLREAWRRPGQQALRGAMGDFMSATKADQVGASLLPHLTSIVAGRGAALLDASGGVVRTHGVTRETALAASLAVVPGSELNLAETVVRLPLTNGSILVWTSPYAPVFGQQDLEMLRSLGTLADLTLERISARKTAEEEQRRSEVFLSSVVDNLPQMVFVKRADDLSFVQFNRAAEELIGYPRAHFIGKNDYDFFPAEQADLFTAKDREVLQGAGVVDIPEEQIDTRSNGQRILHTKKIPLLNADGEPEYLLGISYDITDRKAAEQELTRAHTEADRANRAKSEFLSRMSHELRTPLNAVLGFAQLLEMDVTDDQRPSVAQIRRAGVHLLDLINEVLDISRIESGQLALSPEPVLVSDVVEEALDLIRPLATARGLILTPDKTSGCQRHIVADRQRIKQVLLNLLSNAVKYNRPGGSVSVSCQPVQGPNGPRLGITVADTGVGIAPADLDRLFIPFDRLGAEQTEVEGTGVGLALSLRLVEAMGGALTVTSEPGVGSTFTAAMAMASEAPLQIDPGPRDPINGEPELGVLATEAARGPRLRLLCIEDNSSNVRLVEQVLARRAEWQLIHAAQGDMGLELAASWTAGPGLDLILLDLHLPDMHGYDLLRQLRSQPATADVPVVALSADATPGQIKRLLAAGADRYLTKPFNVNELLGILDRVAQGDRPREETRDAVQI
jgi:PAS domain S-box-containing protein